MKFVSLLPFVALLAVAACSPKGAENGATSYAGESPAASMTAAEASSLSASVAALLPVSSSGVSSTTASSFTGKWTGPEGTSLTITPLGVGTSNYTVTVQNLDGPRDFPGSGTDAGITFTRDGKTLTIHHGSGADTGMKWLADKKDCLVVDANEGYCRG